MKNGKITIEQAYLSMCALVDNTPHIIDKLFESFFLSYWNSNSGQVGIQLLLPFDGDDNKHIDPIRKRDNVDTPAKKESGKGTYSGFKRPTQGGGRYDRFH